MTLYARSTDGTTLDMTALKPTSELGPEGWVHLFDGAPEADLNANSWYIVDETIPRPPNTPTETFVQNVVNVGAGLFEKQWVHNPIRHAARLVDEDGDAKLLNVKGALSTIRSRAAIARAADADAGNAVAILNTVLDDLADFLDWFADYVESREGPA